MFDRDLGLRDQNIFTILGAIVKIHLGGGGLCEQDCLITHGILT